jgi:hypothetical protein
MSWNYGADQQAQKVAALVEKKAQLEAALPVVDDARAAAIESRLDRIEAQIKKEIAHAQAIGNVEAVKAAMGIDGIGGLEFQAQAPAGVGRMVRLPFYPTSGVTGYTTGGGAAAASTTVPVITATIPPNQGNSLAGITLNTPQISWATLRIVGFETDIHTTYNNPGATVAAATVTESVNSMYAPKLLVQDLQIGGGANLFTHEDYADGEIYDSAQPEFCGLRDYPILKSPNTAQVTVAAVGNGGSAAGAVAGAQTITFSCALLCEVLQDDNYGSHIPGPYARKGAMVRRGGSFV